MEATNKKDRSINKMSTKLMLVDEYFNNGLSATKAVRAVIDKECTAHEANNIMAGVMKTMDDEVKDRQVTAQAIAGITNKELLIELVGMMRADVRDYVGLTEESVKELSPDKAKRIQRLSIKTSEVTVNGVTTKNTITDIQTVDRLAAAKEIGKHIGFYQKDNAQKQKVINVEKLNVENINALINALE